MNRFWTPVLRPLLEAAAAQHVIEIGADKGRTSTRLARWCCNRAARADIIDPAPDFDTSALEQAFPGVVHVHLAPSLEVLAGLPVSDVVLIDGDHNWYTVYHEVMMLLGSAEAPLARPPILVLHDTEWPWGRRDAYYDIDRIPPEFRQPNGRGQIHPTATGWSPRGIDTSLVCAQKQGGPRNGVRTGLDDALAGRKDQFEIYTLPLLWGLTFVVPKIRLAERPELVAFLTGIQVSPHLKPLFTLLEAQNIEAIAAISYVRDVLGTGATDFAPDTTQTAQVASRLALTRPLQTALSTEAWRGIHRGVMQQRYKGRRFGLNPFDQYLYMSLIETLRPATIIEVGTYEGGRALWMADQMRAFGLNGRVLALDLAPPKGLSDPLIEVLEANAFELTEVLTHELLAELPRPWLVIEDAAHTTAMSRAVLDFFDDHLQSGDHIVIEDGITGTLAGQPENSPPHAAIRDFLDERGQDYVMLTGLCDHYGYNMTANPNGWLRRL